MTQLRYCGNFLILIFISIYLFFSSCKKEVQLENCQKNNIDYDANFILFPKTGGLWIHTLLLEGTPNNTVIDSFTIGLPTEKLVYTIPYGEYMVSTQVLNSTPNLKLFYPLIQKKIEIDSLGMLVNVAIDTVFWIREELDEKAVYRTLDDAMVGYPDKLFEMVYMDYDLEIGNTILSYNQYYGYSYFLNSYYINGYDSLYFNKRYLRRYFTQMTAQKVIQGFDIAFGFYEMVNISPKRKKAFYYKNDSIVQNYYY